MPVDRLRQAMRDGGALIASIVAVKLVVITLGFLVWWMFIKRGLLWPVYSVYLQIEVAE